MIYGVALGMRYASSRILLIKFPKLLQTVVKGQVDQVMDGRYSVLHAADGCT